MITQVCQRWRAGRANYRPAGEPFDPAVCDVELMPDDARAKAFVVAHHYSGSYPAARYRVALYERSELAGVAVFSQPMRDVVTACVPGDRLERVELGRFILLDRVRANAETWFLARAFELLRREGVAGVVSFSDPEPRETDSGAIVFAGHLGTIYQAHNATYLGRARADWLRLLPDGSVFHNRALAKIRKRDRGWRYSAAILEHHGAEPLRDDEDANAWAERWVSRLTRRMRHGGNHKYCWALAPAARRALPRHLASLGLEPRAYPKILAPQLALPLAG